MNENVKGAIAVIGLIAVSYFAAYSAADAVAKPLIFWGMALSIGTGFGALVMTVLVLFNWIDDD